MISEVMLTPRFVRINYTASMVGYGPGTGLKCHKLTSTVVGLILPKMAFNSELTIVNALRNSYTTWTQLHHIKLRAADEMRFAIDYGTTPIVRTVKLPAIPTSGPANTMNPRIQT